VPRVSHEGLAFDAAKSMYFIDELNGGSVYKYVSANPNASTGDEYFNAGQTFVLKVGAGGQFEGNNGPAITGAASWVAITTAAGTHRGHLRRVQEPGWRQLRDGRPPPPTWFRHRLQPPEDLELQDVNGTQLICTSPPPIPTPTPPAAMAPAVCTSWTWPPNEVKLFADSSSIDLATGLAVGGGLRSSDNLAIDADGNIYIIEDRNGGVDNDIWFAKDLNKDGDLLDAGEGLGRWASNGTVGSENRSVLRQVRPQQGLREHPAPPAVWTA
jgi:hypothetical protein